MDDKFTALERQLQDLRATQQRMHQRIRALEELVAQLNHTDDTQPMTRVVIDPRSSGRA